MGRPRTKKQPINVLNAVVIDNRKDREHWFISFKYDGIRVDLDCNEANGLCDRFRRALTISDPDVKEIEMKLWFIDDRLILKRTDIYAMYIKLKQILRIYY